ncbi:MAG: transposase [Nitrospirae bacterium]|nr:MAG: transposase [Nitrospirota bacterium]
MRLVDALREAGWSVAGACRLVGLSRSGYYAVRQERPALAAGPNPSDEALLARIRPITGVHPFWGYRRVWAWLRYRERLQVNTKRVDSADAGGRLDREAGAPCGDADAAGEAEGHVPPAILVD